jgi:hypothetical protein
MKGRPKYILRAIRKEKVRNVAGKKPLDGDEFKKDDSTLSRAVKKYFTRIVEILAI